MNINSDMCYVENKVLPLFGVPSIQHLFEGDFYVFEEEVDGDSLVEEIEVLCSERLDVRNEDVKKILAGVIEKDGSIHVEHSFPAYCRYMTAIFNQFRVKIDVSYRKPRILFRIHPRVSRSFREMMSRNYECVMDSRKYLRSEHIASLRVRQVSSEIECRKCLKLNIRGCEYSIRMEPTFSSFNREFDLLTVPRGYYDVIKSMSVDGVNLSDVFDDGGGAGVGAGAGDIRGAGVGQNGDFRIMSREGGKYMCIWNLEKVMFEPIPISTLYYTDLYIVARKLSSQTNHIIDMTCVKFKHSSIRALDWGVYDCVDGKLKMRVRKGVVGVSVEKNGRFDKSVNLSTSKISRRRP